MGPADPSDSHFNRSTSWCNEEQPRGSSDLMNGSTHIVRVSEHQNRHLSVILIVHCQTKPTDSLETSVLIKFPIQER